MTKRYRIVSFKLLRWIKRLITDFRQALPHACLLCSNKTAHYSNQLCDTCRGDLPFPDQLCIGCSLSLPSDIAWCGQCQITTPGYPIVTACYYQSPIKQLLSDLKYRKQLIVCHELAHFLARRVFKLINQGFIDKPQALLPVPLHWQRRLSRGFNQAELIAHELSRYLNIPVINNVSRAKSTSSQAQLNAKQRKHNLDNAFKLNKPFTVVSIAIIDDVYTTGATMQEISDTILRHQQVHIQHWAVARTIISD